MAPFQVQTGWFDHRYRSLSGRQRSGEGTTYAELRECRFGNSRGVWSTSQHHSWGRWRGQHYVGVLGAWVREEAGRASLPCAQGEVALSSQPVLRCGVEGYAL